MPATLWADGQRIIGKGLADVKSMPTIRAAIRVSWHLNPMLVISGVLSGSGERVISGRQAITKRDLGHFLG